MSTMSLFFGGYQFKNSSKNIIWKTFSAQYFPDVINLIITSCLFGRGLSLYMCFHFWLLHQKAQFPLITPLGTSFEWSTMPGRLKKSAKPNGFIAIDAVGTATRNWGSKNKPGKLRCILVHTVWSGSTAMYWLQVRLARVKNSNVQCILSKVQFQRAAETVSQLQFRAVLIMQPRDPIFLQLVMRF